MRLYLCKRIQFSLYMTKLKITIITLFQVLSCSLMAENHRWTLRECIDYALENNIQLKQKSLTTKSSHETVVQSKSALLPSVSFSTSQNMNYRPFSSETINLDGGTLTANTNAVSYNGSYGINARWTVWNGGRNRMAVKINELTEQQNELAEQEQSNTIQEQITKLYVQILYETEAIKVSEEILKASQIQLERAKVMVEVGELARVDQIQLEAQVAQDELTLVQVQSQLANFKLQLKQLLEIHDGEPFDVAVPAINDDNIMSAIPLQSDVYAAAIENRPEIKSQQLNVESSKMSVKSARASYFPTVSVNGGIGSSNGSGQQQGFGSQIKRNFSNTLGLTVSVPIFDNKEAKTNIRKAQYAHETAELQLLDVQKQLYSTIENYCLDATTSQKKYVYAKKNVDSMNETYGLVSEQFRLGLKNIVELTNGKNNLIQAKQQLLETKYTALFNLAMLHFYQGESINL